LERLGANLDHIRKVANQALGDDSVYVEWAEIEQENRVVGSQDFFADLGELICIRVELRGVFHQLAVVEVAGVLLDGFWKRQNGARNFPAIEVITGFCPMSGQKRS
jgi:hypothetical protein